MQRVLLFVNPVFDQRQSQRQALARIAALLKREGCAVEVLQSLSAQSAGEQAREAVASGFDTVFVCGGDGTFFRVLQGLAGAEIPVGILPFGTGNVLVQNLELPRDPVEAVQRLLRARARAIPLGRITCHRTGHLSAKSYVFMIAAGMGLHAALMHAAQSGSKSVGGRAAYYWGGVQLLLRHPVEPFDVEITDARGEVTQQQASELIAVRVAALNRWRPAGDLDQPLLRLALVPPTTRLGLAHASYRALAGEPAPSLGHAPGASEPDPTSADAQPGSGAKRLPMAAYYDAVRVVCRAIPNYPYKAKILTEADGEVLGDSSATIEMAEEKLNLLWPD
jgi:diacylglycerol kinase (ATP)